MPFLSRARRAFSRSRHTDRRSPQTEPLENRRLLADAAAGFGDDGWFAVAIGPGMSAELRDLHRQADGKLVAIFSIYSPYDHGSTLPPPHTDFGVARFNADGTLDATFGGDGVVFTDVADKTNDHPLALAVQPDGKIVVAGMYYREGNGRMIDIRPALVRYNPDGALDGSFGDGGKVVGREGDERDAATAVALDEQGRILVGAERRTQQDGHSTTAYDPGVWRYNPDGSVDATYGENGRTVLGTSTTGGRIQALVVQPGGGVLAGGHVYADNGPSNAAVAGVLYLAKLDAAGRFDHAFGAAGQVASPRIGENLEDIAQLPDGRVVIAGSRRAPQDEPEPTAMKSRGLLAAYHADGTPDTSFGDDGVTLVGDEAGVFQLFELSVDGAGRFVASGLDMTEIVAREQGARATWFIGRFTADGRADATFGDAGTLKFGGDQAYNARVSQIIPTPEGLLVGGSYSRHESDRSKLYVARFGPDGAGNTVPPAEDPPAVEAPDLSSNPPDYGGVYTEPPEGWTVNFAAHAYNHASLWLHGPDTDDTVRVTRNPTLPAAIDLDINGQVMTINFNAGPSLSWGITTGGGNDHIEVMLTTGSEFAGSGQLYGGDGNDVLINGDFGTLMVGGTGDDILVGGRGNDTLWGDDGVDQLYGMEGDDRISPGMTSYPAPGTSPYAPVLEGEVYDGGAGNDVFQTQGRQEDLPDSDPPLVPPIDLPRPPADPRVPFETPTPPGMNVTYNLDPFGRTANVHVETTDGPDTVRVTRNTALENGMDVDVNGNVLTLDLDAGPIVSVSLNTLGGDDRVVVVLGGWFGHASRGLHLDTGDGDDQVINHGDYGFIINGAAGNDVLRGGPGGEYLLGGPGVDKLYGGDGNDTLHVGYVEVSPTGPAPVEEGEVYDPGTGRDLVVTGDGETRYFNGRPVEEEQEGDGNALRTTFTGRATVRRGKNYTFTVTYAAPFGDTVDRQTIGEGDVTVSGPGGFTAPAQLVGARAKRGGSVVVARYRVAAPGGTFDAADNGTYTVRIGEGAVNTMAGRVASVQATTVTGNRPTGTPAADLGTFTVAARTRGRPEGATSIVRIPVP